MIVLDTHTLIWWVTGDEMLSDQAKKTIESEMSLPGGQIIISAISAWEIAMLVEKKTPHPLDGRCELARCGG
ncbi:MAG: PIN domain nuclease of toxin-antitoxin system [Bradyrhizobium sp.]|jgi:PIN domain nuclease of toxin-antitoxin system